MGQQRLDDRLRRNLQIFKPGTGQRGPLLLEPTAVLLKMVPGPIPR